MNTATGTGTDDAAAAEAARRLFAAECRFVAGAARLAQLPEPGLPEIAFAGRSNVGKSSLINALTGRRQLAIVSVTPGRTRQINFFDLGGRLTLVDLPGYGYAAAAKAAIAEWTELVDRYLCGRPALRRVLLLIDARHGAKEPDRRAMAMLDQAAVSFQGVLTKADKVSASELTRVRAALAAELAGHPAAHPQLLATSARDGAGLADLRAALAPLTLWAADGGG
ncbi:MAG: ribosome biogenesis GTP-binding protein YihA/YsxC [Rhodospirillales bacterium]|nr:ribosome biogenesis GTP-binding protein YihA/YsxC [Rhodospirillales bacterium]